jgi:hypothetical protein
VVNVTGAEVIPSSTYSVQFIASGCSPSDENNYSPSLTLTTSRHGDIAAPFQASTPPLTQPNGLDVTAMVNKFRNIPGASSKVIAQLQPNVPDPNADVNALDVTASVDAFRGFKYPYAGPCACPSTVPCSTTACATNNTCTALYGAGALCVKTCSSGPRIGHPCNNNLNCGSCVGGTNPGIPCDASSDCTSSNCSVGVCPTGATPGFCRDRCGRCN